MRFQGFIQDSFDFLKGLKSNNNIEWITANWSRYEDLKTRIKALVQDVAETYISLKYPDLETRADSTHCLSRINRRQASKEGEVYHKYLWAAFYRKCRGNKTKDFQLYITIHGSFFETGLYFGYYTSEFFKNKFREKVRREKDAFIGLAKDLPIEFKFPVTRNVSTHDNPPEGLRVENETSLDQWLKSSNLEIVKVYDANDPIVRSPRLVEAVIEDFKILDPIYRFIWAACENVQEEDELRAREEEKFSKKTLKARPSEISIRTEEINIPNFLQSVNLESSSYRARYTRDS
jgi:uncharacterized protein (DUF2461 family)